MTYMKNHLTDKIPLDIIYAIFVVAFSSLFAIVNYFFGFNLPLYVITMLVGAGVALAYPRAGLYAMIFLTFVFERFYTLVPVAMGRSEYKLYPIDVLFCGVIAGMIFQIATGNLKIVWKKIDIVAGLFIFLSMAYFVGNLLFSSGNISLAFSSAKNYAFYSLLYFVVFILIDSRQRLVELGSAIFAGAIAIIWFVVYGIAVRHGLWSDFTPLSTDGIRTLAFTHGFYLSMTLILALIYLAHKKDTFSRWLLVLMPIWTIGIIGSMMRHLWISLLVSVIGVIVLFGSTQKEKLKRYAYSYGVILIILAIIVTYVVLLFPRSSFYENLSSGANMLSKRVTSITNTNGDESIFWRGAVWQSAIKKYAESPVLGIGFGQSVSVEIGSYRDFVEVRNIHNSFLVLLVQMGIFGLSMILTILVFLSWNVFKYSFKDETFQIAAYASLGILVFQFVAFMFQPYLEANLLGIFFWINLAVLRRLYGEKIA